MDSTFAWFLSLALLSAIAGWYLKGRMRVVASNERLIVFRMGRTNPSMMKGPGRAFLVPMLDSGRIVDLGPQRFVLEDLPATTADGRDIGVQVSVAFRAVDPFMFGVSVGDPAEHGIRARARSALGAVVTGMSLGDALTAGRIDDAIREPLDERLIMDGAGDLRVHVDHVRAGSVIEADAQRDNAIRRASGWRPDPDTSGSHTMAGDVAWGFGRFGRIARFALITVPIAIVVLQPFADQLHLAPWSVPGIGVGVMVGLMVGWVWDRPDAPRKVLGWRRSAIWWVAVCAWWGVLLGAIGVLALVDQMSGGWLTAQFTAWTGR